MSDFKAKCTKSAGFPICVEGLLLREGRGRGRGKGRKREGEGRGETREGRRREGICRTNVKLFPMRVHGDHAEHAPQQVPGEVVSRQENVGLCFR